jgi:hypothetical protein
VGRKRNAKETGQKGNWVNQMHSHNFLKNKVILKQAMFQKLNDLESKLLTKNNCSDRQSGQLDGRTLK